MFMSINALTWVLGDDYPPTHDKYLDLDDGPLVLAVNPAGVARPLQRS